MKVARTKRHTTGSVRFDKRRGTWNYLWYDGPVRRSKRLGTKQDLPSKAAAWKAVDALETEQAKPKPAGDTMETVIARYEAERMPERHSTARVYRCFIKNHISPRWAGTLIEDVQPRPVELWLKELPLSPKSKTHVRSLMHGLVEHAMFSGVLAIGRNPISLVKNKGATKRTRTPRSLTAEQFHTLLKELREPVASIALMCVCLGLRVSEALGLQWADVDWLGARLHVRRGVVNQRTADLKTAGSAKALSLSPELLDRLRTVRAASEFTEPGDWVFPSILKLGRLPYSYTGVRMELKRASEAAGLGHIASHAFRHTYRSWLDAAGTAVAVQQKMMRHTDIRTTMNVYGDVVTDEMETAAGKVAGMAFSSNGAHPERGAS